MMRVCLGTDVRSQDLFQIQFVHRFNLRWDIDSLLLNLQGCCVILRALHNAQNGVVVS
jgi:hypothetical protein